MRKCTVAICGMHRSHTSLMASWLCACGLNIGHQLMPGGVGNPKGFYEDLDFVALHDEILEKNQLHALSVKQPIVIATKDRYQGRILIETRSQKSEPWGWKDPRTTLFLKDLWLPIVPDLKIVYIYRSASEVVDSLLYRDFQHALIETERMRWPTLRRLARQMTYTPRPPLNADHYTDQWLQYNKSGLDALSGIIKDNVIVTSLDHLLSRHEYIIEYIKQNWGIKLSTNDPNALYSPAPSRRRFHSGISKKYDRQTQEILDELNALTTI